MGSNPASPTTKPDNPTSSYSRRRLVLAIVLLAAGIGLGVAGVVRRNAPAAALPAPVEVGSDVTPEATTAPTTGTSVLTTTTSTAPPAAPVPFPPAGAEASATRPSQRTATGTATHGADLAIDGRPETAWCALGDAVGASLTLRFSSPVQVSEVGITAGYDKIDPASGADRFGENRRITRARYTFADGTEVEQSLDPTLRTVQRRRLPAALTTTTVQVTVLATTDGDDTCISEAQVLGRAT